MTIDTGMAVLVAGLVAGLAPLALGPILRRAGVIDNPNHRSSHVKPTLRGGGAAQLLAITVGGAIGALTLSGRGALTSLVVVCGGVAVGLVGFCEDVRGLPVRVRLSLQIVIGTGVGVVLSTIWSAAWVAIPIAAVIFASYVNFANFMDGINGISALYSVATGLSYTLLGLAAGQPWLTFTGALFAVSFGVFLFWNLIPPGMFLGDVGSYLLGGVLSSICLAAMLAGIHPVVAVAPLSIYFADTITTLFRRTLKRETVYQAHRQHIYQRLTDGGLTHIQVSVLVTTFTVLTGVVGLLVAYAVITHAAAIVMILVIVSIYLFLPNAQRVVSKTKGEIVDA